MLLSLLTRVLRRHIIVYHYVHALDIDTATENVSADHNSLLDILKGTEACDTLIDAYRSGWERPPWMVVLGNLEATKIRFNSIARWTLRTKMTNWLNYRASMSSINLLVFESSLTLS